MTARKFRSLLPHEPLPQEEKGFIHLQGAFTPKRRHSEEGLQTDLTFWSRGSLTNALQEVLVKTNDESPLDLPFAVENVELLDEEPPFTKVRLLYGSPLQAYHNLIAWRKREASPATLFSNYASDDLQFRNKDLSVSQITQSPLPSVCWNRSNPPKFRRYIPRLGEDVKELEMERNQTRIVFVTNILEDRECEFWKDPHCVIHAIRQIVDEYDSSGDGMEVFCTAKKMHTYCHVGARSSEDARKLIESLQDRQVTWKWSDASDTVHSTTSGKLFLDFAGITDRSVAKSKRTDPGTGKTIEPPKYGCTSTTAHVTVPGLILVPEFCTAEEEAILMATLTGPHAPWSPSQTTKAGGNIKRQVQHYGYVFDYQTANVLRDRGAEGANCPEMPALPANVQTERELEDHIIDSVKRGSGWEVFASVVERTRRKDFDTKGGGCSFNKLNQLTVNHYKPGEGIGSHVDTPSAFGDGLISLSLNGGITMEFRQVDGDQKKYVYLPPRSLLLMSGPARYEWEHMIVSRMTDTHENVVIPRILRVSLTMRTALKADGSVLPLVETRDFPPTWGTSELTIDSVLHTPACERDHVHAVYNAVAKQWHHTRGRRGVLWPGATEFLNRLAPCSLVADVGCGDGKYFPAIWEAGSYVIGTDISFPLLRTAFDMEDDDSGIPENRRVHVDRKHLSRRPAIAVADCMNIPLRDKSCDAAICIAVLHHLSTEARRKRCIEELARIVKPGGMINIQAWALDQEEDSRRKFAANDVFVPFNAQPKYLALSEEKAKSNSDDQTTSHEKNEQSTAELYSKTFNADFDDRKGLVVFQRYCHLYRQGELGEIVSQVPNVELLEEGFESGNYFVILRVID